MDGSPDDQLLLGPLRRLPAVRELAEGPATRAALQERLDVSRATLHRVVTNLVDADLAVETDDGVELTPFGEEVAAAADDYADRVGTAERVAPLLNSVEPSTLPVAVPPEAFADADVLRPAPTQPDGPIQRGVEAVRAADDIRAFAPVILPSYVAVVHEEVLDGMACELVVDEEALAGLRDSYGEELERAADTERLDVHVHDAVPFGLLVTDEEVCVVAYDEDGVLTCAVAGDGGRLRTWAEDCYERYRAAAEPMAPGE